MKYEFLQITTFMFLRDVQKFGQNLKRVTVKIPHIEKDIGNLRI